jgi:hypothetical protein
MPQNAMFAICALTIGPGTDLPVSAVRARRGFQDCDGSGVLERIDAAASERTDYSRNRPVHYPCRQAQQD